SLGVAESKIGEPEQLPGDADEVRHRSSMRKAPVEQAFVERAAVARTKKAMSPDPVRVPLRDEAGKRPERAGLVAGAEQMMCRDDARGSGVRTVTLGETPVEVRARLARYRALDRDAHGVVHEAVRAAPSSEDLRGYELVQRSQDLLGFCGREEGRVLV